MKNNNIVFEYNEVRFDNKRSLTNYILNREGPSIDVNKTVEFKSIVSVDGVEANTSTFNQNIKDLASGVYLKKYIVTTTNSKGVSKTFQGSNLSRLARQAKLSKYEHSTVFVNCFELVGDKAEHKLTYTMTMTSEEARITANSATKRMVSIKEFTEEAVMMILEGRGKELRSDTHVRTVDVVESGSVRGLEHHGLINNIIKIDFLVSLKLAGVQGPNSKAVKFPIRKREGNRMVEICSTIEEARYRILSTRIDGHQLGGVASDSMTRGGTGFFGIIGSYDTVEEVINIVGNKHYSNTKGQKVTQKDVSRNGQNFGGSINVCSLYESHSASVDKKRLSYQIIENPTISDTALYTTLDLGNNKAKKQEMTRSRVVGDGAAYGSEKAFFEIGLAGKHISEEEYEIGLYSGFDLKDPKTRKAFDKIPKAVQTRPFKSLMIFRPASELLSFGYESDIVITESCIKGTGEINELNVIAFCKKAGEKNGRTSMQFLQACTLRVADSKNGEKFFSNKKDKDGKSIEITYREAVAQYLIQLTVGNINSILNHKENALSVERFIDDAIRTDKLNSIPGMSTNPYMISKSLSQVLDGDFDKVELEGSEMAYIVDDYIYVLSGGTKQLTTDRGAVHRRKGDILGIRYPLTHQSGATRFYCNGTDNVLPEYKDSLDYIINDWAIMVLPLDALFVFYIDGADQDGDKMLLVWKEDHPIFFGGIDLYTADNVPFYLEDIEGKRVEVMMEASEIFRSIVKNLFKDNGIGKIVNTCMVLFEAICIKHDELTILVTSSTKDKETLVKCQHELLALYSLLSEGKIANNLAIDQKLSSEMESEFMDKCKKPIFKFKGQSLPILINGKQRDLTKLEYLNWKGTSTYQGGLEGIYTSECTSVYATMLKKRESMFDYLKNIVSKEIALGLEENNSLNTILKVNGIDEHFEGRGVIASVTTAIMKRFNQEVMYMIEERSDEEGSMLDDSAFQQDFRGLVDEYKEEFGDIVRDWRYGVCALNLASNRMVDNFSKISNKREGMKIHDLKEIVRGCSFAFNVFEEALLNIGSTVKISSENDLLVYEGDIYKIKGKGRKTVASLTTLQVKGMYPVADGLYKSNKNEVILSKDHVNSSLELEFNSNKTVPSGNYYVHAIKGGVFLSTEKNIKGSTIYAVEGRRSCVLYMYYDFEKKAPVGPIKVESINGGFRLIDENVEEVVAERQTSGKTFSEVLSERTKETLYSLEPQDVVIAIEVDGEDYEVHDFATSSVVSNVDDNEFVGMFSANSSSIYSSILGSEQEVIVTEEATEDDEDEVIIVVEEEEVIVVEESTDEDEYESVFNI